MGIISDEKTGGKMTGYLEGAEGEKSSMRVMAVVVVVSGVLMLAACAVVATVRGSALDPQVVIGALGLVGLGLGGKAVQKFAEVTGDKNGN